jgi:carboxypeptidase Q
VRSRLVSASILAALIAASPLAIGAQSTNRRQTPAPAAPAAAVPAPVADRADLDAVYRLKDEGLQRSQVMDTAWYLTELHGARLTNSPGMHAAAAWAIERMNGWGLANVRRETWGPFGRGWTSDRFVANVVAPQPFPLLAFARAWTPGTDGPVTADVMIALVDREDDFKKYEGKLRGKIVLAARPPAVPPLLTPLGRRYTEQELTALESQPVAAPRGGGPGPAGQPVDPNFGQRRMQFFAREGVVAVLEPGSGRSDHGAMVVQGPSRNRESQEPQVAAQVVVATEHYNRLSRLLNRNVPVRIELDVRNRYLDDTLDSYNIIAELPGTDRRDEVVMLGAHFDSWHAGTGATDNAAGSAVMMEAMRILKATGLPLRRTVRLALWTGEEQGLLGSRAYVKQQFGDPATMALLPGHQRLSAYFNMDNGSGAFRGVFLQGNEAIRPAFAAWMEPFRNLGMTTLSIRNTGSTDHIPFDEVGLPGFQFIQDPLEYGTHSHHTNMDVYDRLQAEDLMKNAVIVASFVYHAANRDALLPRKTLPAARRTSTN